MVGAALQGQVHLLLHCVPEVLHRDQQLMQVGAMCSVTKLQSINRLYSRKEAACFLDLLVTLSWSTSARGVGPKATAQACGDLQGGSPAIWATDGTCSGLAPALAVLQTTT